MKKALLATVMAFLVSSVGYADELRLEAGASAKLGDNTLSATEQTRHDLSISEDMVTKAAGYEHTEFAISRALTDKVGLSFGVRNTNTAGASTNRLQLDLNVGVGLPAGIGLENRLRLQVDAGSDITAVTKDSVSLREKVTVSKTVALPFVSLDLSIGDEIHANEGGITENRIEAAVTKEVCPGLSATAGYFRQMNTDGDDANVVTVSAALTF